MADTINLGDIAMPRSRRRRPARPLSDEERAIVDDVMATVDNDEPISAPRPEASPLSSVSPAAGLDLQLQSPTMRPTSILRRMAREESERRIAAQPLNPAVADDGPDVEPDADPDDNLFGPAPAASAHQPGPPSASSPSLRGGPIPEEAIIDDASAAAVTNPNAPGQRQKAANERPSIVALTPEEKDRIATADTQDRRRRIARGVMGGLGLLGGIAGGLSGSQGLAGLGEALMAGGGAIRSDRRDRVQAGIDQRVANETQAQQAYDTSAQQAAAGERQAAEAAIEQRRAEASARLDEARAQGLISENERATQQAAIDERARQANIEAARAGLSARVGAVQHAGTRQAWESGLPAMLAAEDPDQLLRQQENVARTDIRRGGQGAGGSGGGSRESTVYNPATGRYETRTVRTGPRSAVAAPRDGAPAPSAGALAPPSPAEGPVDSSTEVAWAERVMSAAGWTDRDRREGVIRRLRTGQGNSAHDSALVEMTDLAGRAERARDRGIPIAMVDMSDAEIAQHNMIARTQLTPILANRRRALNLLRDIRGWRRDSPIALRAAIETIRNPDSASNFSPDVLARAQDITRQFNAYVNPMLAERSGAAVTNNEMSRALRELGLASAMGDLGALERAFDAQVTDWENLISDRTRDLHPAFVQQWARAHGFGGE